MTLADIRSKIEQTIERLKKLSTTSQSTLESVTRLEQAMMLMGKSVEGSAVPALQRFTSETLKAKSGVSGIVNSAAGLNVVASSFDKNSVAAARFGREIERVNRATREQVRILSSLAGAQSLLQAPQIRGLLQAPPRRTRSENMLDQWAHPKVRFDVGRGYRPLPAWAASLQTGYKPNWVQVPPSHQYQPPYPGQRLLTTTRQKLLQAPPGYYGDYAGGGPDIRSQEEKDRDAGISQPTPPLWPPSPRFRSMQTLEAYLESGVFGNVPGGQVGITNLKRELGKFSGDTRISEPPTSKEGIYRIGLTARDADGAISKSTVTLGKHGQVIRRTSASYKDLLGQLGRNIGEFAKWTIASTVVYGAVRLMNQALQLSIEIQSQLADVQIATGQSAHQMATVFASAGSIAKETGSDIMGVIEGYDLAYAAAGAVEEPLMRTAVTEQLLTDSMVLSKLAAMDQAQALDVLVAALSQTGSDLDESTKFLDMWVAIAKEANVSIEALATAFAVVGAAAGDAGIEPARLSAMSAVLAEALPISPTEGANAIRGFISGFQTSNAEEVLDRYGIAVRNLTGDYKTFATMMEQVIRLRDAGVLSEEAIAEIANAVGGGFRRGSQLTTLMDSWARVGSLEQVGLGADGDAADALSIRLDLVKTSVVELSNAFTILADTLGSDAGFLGAADTTLDLLTLMTQTLDILIGGLGEATPLIGILGAGMLGLTKTARGQGMLSGQGLFGGAIGQAYGYGQTAMKHINKIPGLGQMSGFGAAATALSVGASFYTGTEERGIGVGTARASGRLIGAAFGTALGGPIGTMAGLAIGGAFADYITKQRPDLAEGFAQMQAGITTPPGDDVVGAGGSSSQERLDAANAALSDGISDLTKATFETYAALISFTQGLEISGEELLAYYSMLAVGRADLIKPQDRRALEFMNLPNAYPGAPDLATTIAQPKTLAQIEELIRAMDLMNVQEGAVTTRQDVFIERATGELGGFQEERRREALIGLAGGDISLKQFDEFNSSIGTIGVKVGQALAAFDLAGITRTSEEVANLLLDIPAELSKTLTVYTDEISRLQYEIETEVDQKTIKRLEAELQAAIDNLGTVLPAVEIQTRLAQTAIPSLIDVTGMTQTEFELTAAMAEINTNTILEFMFPGDDEIKQGWREKREVYQYSYRDEMGKVHLLGPAPAFMPGAFQQAQQASAQAVPQGIMDWRGKLQESDRGRFESMYAKAVGGFQSVGYQVEETNYAVMLDSGIEAMTLNQMIANMILQDIYEVNKEQLEGVFNIPEGTTAMIPLTGDVYISRERASSRSGGGSGVTDYFEEYAAAIASGTAGAGPISTGIPVISPLGPYDSTPPTPFDFDQGPKWYDTPNAIPNRTGSPWAPARADVDPFSYSKETEGRGGLSGIVDKFLTDLFTSTFSAISGGMGPASQGTNLKRLEDLGMSGKDLGFELLPESIPVTLDMEFANQTIVMVDGSVIQEAIESRMFTSFKTAKRSKGSTAYVSSS